MSALRPVHVPYSDQKTEEWHDARHGHVFFRTIVDGDGAATAGLVQDVGRLPPGGREKRHHHPICETLFVISGRGVAEIEERRIALAPGDCLFVPPGTPHAWTAPDEEMRFLYSFPADRFAEVAYRFEGDD